ncbi:MAG: hypothetical protein ABI663_00785 [Chryseolinea sp.]
MKGLAFTTVVWIISTSFIMRDEYLDPTGTYILDQKTKKVGEEIYGYFGEIQVVKLKEDKILMNFSICKGAPSYNSGSFLDTLSYQNNRALFTDPSTDSSCVITFDFTVKGITVKEDTDDYNFGCGFGHAVIADGFFKKTSSKKPEIPVE